MLTAKRRSASILGMLACLAALFGYFGFTGMAPASMELLTKTGLTAQTVCGVILVPLVLTALLSVSYLLADSKHLGRFLILSLVLMAVSQVAAFCFSLRAANKNGIEYADMLSSNIGWTLFAILAAVAFALAFAGLLVCMRSLKIHIGYTVLYHMAVIWLFPVLWIILTSFRAEKGTYTSYIIPRTFTLDNYIQLLTDYTVFEFPRWFFNTLYVASMSCLLTTFIVLSTAFVLSRLRFPSRKPFMNILLILGMFPGFMSMIAVYYILKGIGLTQNLNALIMIYAGGGALTYYVAKGFFDTIPKSLDEAAWIDGATKWTLFTKITMPLSKPIIIYTALISFIAPWADLIFAQIIIGDDYNNYTVAVGMFAMLERQYIVYWYTRFAAAAVLISIPISVLFICLQKYYVEGLSGSVKG